MIVPWSNTRPQYKIQEDEINNAVKKVLENGDYILNDDVFAFEEEFASYCDVKHGVSVHSGSDAITLSLIALGVEKRDEVISVANACWSIPNAIIHSGAIPILADIDMKTYNIDPNQIEDKVTSRTKAILAVHSYGQPCDIAYIKEIAGKHGITVIEDISVAPGTMIKGQRVGSFGDITVVSFSHGKILTAYGNCGGMVLTDSIELAERVKMFARFGQRKMRSSEVSELYADPTGRVCGVQGYNSYLDSIQAAVLRVKLRKLDQWLNQRAEKARLYDEKLSGLEIITPYIRDGVTSAYRGYITRVKNRNHVFAELLSQGIEATTLYLPPVHLQPAMSSLGYREGDFPVTELVARELITLPIYPELSSEQIEHVVKVLHDCVPLKRNDGVEKQTQGAII